MTLTVPTQPCFCMMNSNQEPIVALYILDYENVIISHKQYTIHTLYIKNTFHDYVEFEGKKCV